VLSPPEFSDSSGASRAAAERRVLEAAGRGSLVTSSGLDETRVGPTVGSTGKVAITARCAKRTKACRVDPHVLPESAIARARRDAG